MTVNKQVIDDYFALQAIIMAGFKYEEIWREFPLEDRREMYWCIDGDEVHFAPIASQVGGDEGYADVVYRSRFVKKAVYETEAYTMIIVDTQTDFNVYLAIFDNSKRLQTMANSEQER